LKDRAVGKGEHGGGQDGQQIGAPGRGGCSPRFLSSPALRRARCSGVGVQKTEGLDGWKKP
jgi:hypothetical protein